MRRTAVFFLLSTTVVAVTGCGAEFSVYQNASDSKQSQGALEPPAPPVVPPVVQPDVPPTEPGNSEIGTVIWDSKRPDSRNWSQHVYDLILEKNLRMIDGADDVEVFCPLFENLDRFDRAHFWTSFVAAVAYYESRWEPTARLVETSMGTDPVTGVRVVSEGLLQLSYQDSRNHPYCNEFDWNADRKLKGRDPAKTILDPIKNLSCGVQILNRQVERYGKLLIDQGAYWAVLKPKRKDRIAGIQNLLKSLAFCQRPPLK